MIKLSIVVQHLNNSVWKQVTNNLAGLSFMTIIRQGHGYLTNNHEYQPITNVKNKRDRDVCWNEMFILNHFVSWKDYIYHHVLPQQHFVHLKLPTGWLPSLIPPLISTLWQYLFCKQGLHFWICFQFHFQEKTSMNIFKVQLILFFGISNHVTLVDT